MSPYFTPLDAGKMFIAKLIKEFGNDDGTIDYEKAAETIYGCASDRNLKNLKFAINHPQFSLDHCLIWEYVGLKLTKVFEFHDRIPNRDSCKSNGEGTEDSSEEVSGSDSICTSPQSYTI
jgi:hypothetical protein